RDAAENLDAGAGIAFEGQTAARHEGVVRHVQGRGDEAGGVDAPVRPDDDAVRVDEIDLAVGAEAAGDQRRIGARDPVKDCRDRGWQVEARRLAGADREALPIDDGAVAALIDGERLAGAGDGRTAGDDIATRRIGPSTIGGSTGRERRQHGKRHERRTMPRHRPRAAASPISLHWTPTGKRPEYGSLPITSGAMKQGFSRFCDDDTTQLAAI